MLSEDIDFYKLFKIHPTAMALLTADLYFIDVNDEFLAVIGREIGDVVGRHAFDVVPKMPDIRGEPVWTALEQALTSKRRTVDELHRYDIEDPDHPGVFVESYWSSVVTPVLRLDGDVDVLELSARDVTSIVLAARDMAPVGNRH